MTFLRLVECLDYLTVRGDEQEHCFDYGYNKENSKILYSMHKMKIPNSFSTTIFNRNRIQYEPGAFSETDFSFFYLPQLIEWKKLRKTYLQLTLRFQSLEIYSIPPSSIMLIQKRKVLENQF